MNKCCGTCKWWEQDPFWEYRDRECLWDGLLPDSNQNITHLMSGTDGENCQCYEARDEQKGGDKVGEG